MLWMYTLDKQIFIWALNSLKFSILKENNFLTVKISEIQTLCRAILFRETDQHTQRLQIFHARVVSKDCKPQLVSVFW